MSIDLKHTLILSDALGNTLLTPTDWIQLEYVRADNEITPCTLTLPGYYDPGFFQRDMRIEVWKELGGRSPYLDTETAWLIRNPELDLQRSGDTWQVQGYCFNDLLRRRLVDYNEANAYTSKLDEADDLGKAVVRENFGSLATDTTRQWATSIFTVQADQALAPIVRKAFANQEVWKVLQELAQTSYEKGTYLVFDVVWNSGVPELRAFINQRGQDHRNPGGNPPVLFGSDFGNLDNVKLSYDWSAEVTRAIAGGQSVGTIMAKARADDAARQGGSPYNLIEGFENVSDEVDATGLADAAQAQLRRGFPKTILTADITQTEGFIRGLHWEWGDRFTAQVRGISFDCRIDRINVTVNRESGEVSMGSVRGEA